MKHFHNCQVFHIERANVYDYITSRKSDNKKQALYPQKNKAQDCTFLRTNEQKIYKKWLCLQQLKQVISTYLAIAKKNSKNGE